MKAKFLLAIALILVFLIPLGVFAQEDNATDQVDIVDLELDDVADNQTKTDDEEDQADVEPEDTVDEEIEELPDPGITPDSPFWRIDVALERIRYKLTLRAEDKARVGLENAAERLAEIKAMAEEKKGDAAEKAQAKHQEIINEVKEDIEEIDGEEGNITGIEQGMANHIAALQKVMEKIGANENIPEAVREKLANKFQNQIANAEELVVKIQNKKAQIALKKAEKKAEEEEDEIEIEVEIEDNITKVGVEIEGEETEFELNTTDIDEIVAEIVDRTGLSEEVVRDNLELEEEELEEDEIEEVEDEEPEDEELEDEEGEAEEEEPVNETNETEDQE